MNSTTRIESKRRAVAPIIATLLMVAIAVVGGILIFVFTQGFFSDSQVTGPTVDNIRIFGYSAADGTTTIGEFDGSSLDTDGAAGSNLASGDAIAIYVENLGDKPVAFQAVRIFGETHTPGVEALALDCETTTGQFNLMTDGGVQASILEPNTQGTLCVEYSGNTVKIGRTIPIQVETANGQSSQINIINGATRGQQ